MERDDAHSEIDLLKEKLDKALYASQKLIDEKDTSNKEFEKMLEKYDRLVQVLNVIEKFLILIFLLLEHKTKFIAYNRDLTLSKLTGTGWKLKRNVLHWQLPKLVKIFGNCTMKVHGKCFINFFSAFSFR